MREVQDCECCGRTTRGNLCRRCKPDDERITFCDSLKHALEYKAQQENKHE